MESLSAYAALISNRADLYGLLARIYRIEVDQPLLDHLIQMRFPTDGGDDELLAGYRRLEADLRRSAPDRLIALAVDYARAFLGAGISSGVVAFPYESVYTSPGRLIMQEARDQVLAAYRAKGFSVSEGFDEPEDHLALELEFMAFLCEDIQQALKKGNHAAVQACLKDQQSFLSLHLLNWVPAFAADIAKCAGTEFYRAVAMITQGFLRLDGAIVGHLLAVAASETTQSHSDGDLRARNGV